MLKTKGLRLTFTLRSTCSLPQRLCVGTTKTYPSHQSEWLVWWIRRRGLRK